MPRCECGQLAFIAEPSNAWSLAWGLIVLQGVELHSQQYKEPSGEHCVADSIIQAQLDHDPASFV